MKFYFKTLLALVSLTFPIVAKARAEIRSTSLAASAFAWDEDLPTGERFVRERGVRLTGSLIRPLNGSRPFEFTYEGAVYGTLTRHQGWDPSRFTIPKGYENTPGGQLGTAHTLRGSLALNAEDVTLKLIAAANIDAWYRPLAYYELWFVPSVSYGLRVESKTGKWSVILGARSVGGARQRTQTTHSPWNSNRNITTRLHADTTPELGLDWRLGVNRTLRVGYSEYRFHASNVTILNNGVGIYQPKSTQRTLTISLVTSR